jgi:hypothetical protein
VLDVFARARLEHDRLEALAREELSKGEPGGPCADDADLRSHAAPALSPGLVRDLDDQAELRPLLPFRQLVALHGGREAALREEARCSRGAYLAAERLPTHERHESPAYRDIENPRTCGGFP